MGLPRPLRLARTEDFARVRVVGQTFRGRLLLLNVAPNGLSHNRYGVVTGKKLGGAVVRNRVRRLFREVLRATNSKLTGGWDIVLVAHPSASAQPASEIQRAFEAAAVQAGLFRE
jgi:ribonuclease P protein component